MTEEPRRSGLPAPLGHESGIDGLRAVAVIVVLLFHSRFSWARGGFLGVSMFFTLSGFLITSLLLREFHAEGRVRLGAFWTRRYRRLLPASLTVMITIIGMGALGVWDAAQMQRLREDALASLAQVANWHFILGERSYGASFAAPSPFEHFWSLAIEEQFYLVFPLLVVVALRAGGGRRHILVGALGGLTLLSATAAAVMSSSDVDRAYFGTDTRLAELTVGALAACVALNRLRPRTEGGRRVATVAAVLGFATMVALWTTATVGSSWMYPWGLLATSVSTIALIVGAMTPGPARSVLAAAPLAAIGTISYGIYLVHWPIFLWLNPVRTGLDPVPLLVVRLAVTAGLATAMYRVIERPVRSRQVLVRPRATRGWAIAAVAAVAFTAIVATRDVAPPPDVLSQVASANAPAPTSPPPPQRVLVVGDQMAGALGPGLAAAGASSLDVRTESLADCGIVVGGFVKVSGDSAEPVERDSARCRHALTIFSLAEAEFRPDVVVVWAGLRDAADRRLSSTAPWVTPFDDSFGDLYRTSLRDLTETLGANGAHVAVLPVPYMANSIAPGQVPAPDPAEPGDEYYEATQLAVARVDAPTTQFPENDPGRIDRLNQLMSEVVDDDPGVISPRIVDEIRARSTGEVDPLTRPDGVTLDPVTSIGVGSWLRSQLLGLERATTEPEVADAPSSLSDVALPDAPAPAPRTVAPSTRPVRVVVVGDSVAAGYAAGLGKWGAASSALTVDNAARFACPLARGGQYRYLREVNEFNADCDWSPRVWNAIDSSQPDVVVLTTGIWDTADRLLPADERWRHIGESDFDRFVLSEMLSAIDLAASQGASVVLLTYPHFEAGRDQGYVGLPESEPERVDRLNEIMVEAAGLRPDVATTIDLQQWVAGQPGGELDPATRIDGLHFSDDYLDTIAQWLGPQIVTIGRG